MKKFLALLLCATMLFSLAVPATQTVEEEAISVCGIFGEEDEYDDGKFGSVSQV